MIGSSSRIEASVFLLVYPISIEQCLARNKDPGGVEYRKESSLALIQLYFAYFWIKREAWFRSLYFFIYFPISSVIKKNYPLPIFLFFWKQFILKILTLSLKVSFVANIFFSCLPIDLCPVFLGGSSDFKQSKVAMFSIILIICFNSGSIKSQLGGVLRDYFESVNSGSRPIT